MIETRPPFIKRGPVQFSSGDYLMISEGNFSNYKVLAFLKMKREITDLALIRAWQAECELCRREGFTLAAFLTREGYAEDVAFWEVNMAYKKED